MSLEEIYQEVILDHFKHPRCRGSIATPSAAFTLFNPLCGDEIELQITLDGEVVTDVGFNGHGCAISQAAASMLSDLCKGKLIREVSQLLASYTEMMKGQGCDDQTKSLGDMVALEGVKRFPARIKCAMLACEAMHKCLDKAVKNSCPECNCHKVVA
jgi:nitrogen fixation NifU-like protein